MQKPITFIFGAMCDKNLSEIAAILFPKADKLIITKPDNPRSMEISKIAEFLPEDFDKEQVYQSETVAEALKIADKITSEGDLILVTGSLYLIGEAQKILRPSD